MVVSGLEIIQFKEITLVLSQAQGTGLGAVRILLLWEQRVTCTLSHPAVLIALCFLAGTCKCILGSFTVAI